MAAEAVSFTAAQLVQAAETALSPASTQIQRSEAYQLIEQVKAESPVCVQAGLMLFNRQHSAVVRHVGLQLIEHCVKFRWNEMTKEEQAKLKDTSMHLLAQGSAPILEEQRHVKESLAKIVVEMIKREWPQKWETLFPDLDFICKMGDTQTELVLIILLRLTEDLFSMPDTHLHSLRRKDMTQMLYRHIEGLFQFFLETLKVNEGKLRELRGRKQVVSSDKEALISVRVAEQTLQTMLGFLEWVKYDVLFADDCVLLQMLCLLLEDENLKVAACECLLMILERKGKIEQRTPYLKLFSEDAMQVFLIAAQKATTVEFDERQYLFLKRLCQVLTTLGGAQLFHMWNKDRPEGKPPNFRQYLEAVLAFNKHHSVVLSLLANGLWLAFLRNEVILKDAAFQSIFPHILELARTKLLKVGDPDNDDSPSCIYNREDFDSSREFATVFAQIRSQTMDIIRSITLVFPSESFLKAAEWLVQRIEESSSSETVNGKTLRRLRVDWEGCACYVEAVMSRMFRFENIQEVLEKQVSFNGKSLKLLDLASNCITALLSVKLEDPHVTASVVDCLNALYPFLAHVRELLADVLKKIFEAVIFNTTGSPQGPWSLDVLHARRHASSAVLRMCRDYGHLLLAVFEDLKKHVQSMFEGEKVSAQDRGVLTESLVYASNQFQDRTRQDAFLTELLEPVKEIWNSNMVKIALSTPESFITFLGMNHDPANYLANDEMRKRRFQLMYCIGTIMAVTKRCMPPEIHESGGGEGLCIGFMPDGTPYPKNVATPHVLPLIMNVLLLLKCINQLYDPIVKSQLFPEYIAALDMHDTERNSIIAVQDSEPPPDRSEFLDTDPVTKTKNYIYYITDTCYHTLGAAGETLGYEFYYFPTLGHFIAQSVVNTIHYLPNYRMRSFIQHFLKPYIARCWPCCYETALMPVIAAAFPLLLQRLEDDWQCVRARQTESLSSGQDERDAESKEVIEDQLVNLVTRDFIDCFSFAFLLKRDSKGKIGVEAESEEPKDEETNTEATPSKAKGPDPFDAKLGDLGILMLQHEEVNQQLLYTVFTCMTWLDSSSCHKACKLSCPIIKQVLALCQLSGSRIPEGVFEQLFSLVLKGLQVHGEVGVYTSLCRVGLQMYELLVKEYPLLDQVLLQITGCTMENLRALEAAVFCEKPLEKRKRDCFKRVVDGIIGKHIGQMFKAEIKIKDLPPLKLPPSKPIAPSVLDQGETGLADLFDPTRAIEPL